MLNKAPVGRVATISPDGMPYIVPVNFAFEGDRIYFHCALEGMKLDYIKANPNVGFEADELLELYTTPGKPCGCTSYYRSVIARGRAAIVTDREKKLHALWLLVYKYAGNRDGEMPAGYRGQDLRCRDRRRRDQRQGVPAEKPVIIFQHGALGAWRPWRA